MPRSRIGSDLALIALAVTFLLPDSPPRDGLRYLALACMLINVFARARAGYLRRRPHWTAESWRQFAIAFAIPAAAVLALVSTFAALGLRLSIVGEPRSTTRFIWAASAGVFIVIGGVGLSVVLGWLSNGEPAQQFVLPRWLRLGRRDTDA